ncbi:MAG TPA: FKBP-type peptidyl-prolyl cis-trans isomerase [Pyrinomonadaceae bacterium]|jgi:peptidylprolyl isomerase
MKLRSTYKVLSIALPAVALLLLVAACASVGQGQTRRRGARAKSGAARVTPKAKSPCASSPARTTPSGLTYVVTRQGTGQQLKAGDVVSVHYTGLLTNGTKFDSSLDRGEPIAFPLGAGRVIKGWDEGVALLRVGDQATLIIPPQLGYGARGAGDGAIPPDATLIFIIEVVGVQEAVPGAAPDR